MTANIRSTLILDLAEFLRGLGHDPEDIFRAAGVPLEGVTDRDMRIPVEAPMALIDTAAYRLGMTDFGLQLARFRGMPDLGPVALIVREKETLGEVLETMTRAFHLHSSALFLSVVDAGETSLLTVDLLTSRHILSRQSAEMIVGGITPQMLRGLLGTDWKPDGIMFRHARAMPARLYQSFFGVIPEFDQEFNGIVLERDTFGRSLERKASAIDRQAREILAGAESEQEVFVYRVRQLIVLLLGRGEAQAERIAGLLGIDRRTLQRRLAAGGLGFTGMLEDVRREFAQQYVLGSERSLAEIAYLVGFDSPEVFSRWYRKAYGLPPSRARVAARD